jgi:polyphosphate kinase
MRSRFLEMIAREAKHASEGRGGRIIAKMNAIVDTEIIEALYSASKAGVEIDLIVRGICCLRPGVAGVSDRIRVVSIVGRFLEHSRVFYFANAGEEEFYFGSADWMPRNFDRRVEAVTPVEDKSLHPRLRSLLDTCLTDNRQAWDLYSDGSYVQRHASDEPERSAQAIFLQSSWGPESRDGRKARARDDTPFAQIRSR